MSTPAVASRGPGPGSGTGRFDVTRIRQDFPILAQEVNGKPLVYLDNAATAQKPRSVLDALLAYYERDNANVHRGVHTLSQRATVKYEEAREKVRQFLNAGDGREIVFLRGATEAINLVARCHGRVVVGHGDEVLVSAMEHHSNIVPWQMLCDEVGGVLRVIPMSEAGELDLDAYRALLGPRTRIVAVGHVSNALGTVHPLAEMIAGAKGVGATVVVDGAQAAPHIPIDVQALGCDFYALSGHKMFGPTGIGALYGRRALLEAMPPYQGGGEMIRSVSFDRTEYAEVPAKFEAGTPHIAGAVGLGAAIDYLAGLPWDEVAAHEADLLAHATASLSAVPGVRIYGPGDRAPVISFTVDDIHAHDLGTIADLEGVAIRTGHHCAQPVMDFYGVPATARASLAFYNTRGEIDALVRAVNKAREVFV